MVQLEGFPRPKGRPWGMGCTTRFRGLPTWRDHSRLNPTERRAARAAPARRLPTRSPRHSSSGFPIHRTEGHSHHSLLPNIWRVSSSSPRRSNRSPPTADDLEPRRAPRLAPVVAARCTRPRPEGASVDPSARRPSPSIQPVPAHHRRLRTVQAPTKKANNTCAETRHRCRCL